MLKKRTAAQSAHVARMTAARLATAATTAPNLPKTRRQGLLEAMQQIDDQDAIICDLNSQLRAAHIAFDELSSRLSAETDRFQHKLDQVTSRLLERDLSVSRATSALSVSQEELEKSRKRIRRVTREKMEIRKVEREKFQAVTKNHQTTVNAFASTVSASERKIASLEILVGQSKHDLESEKLTSATLRKKVHSLDMQQHRAKRALLSNRKHLSRIHTWKATTRGTYTMEARQLSRALLRAGCAGDRVGDAIYACAKAFKVCVKGVPSRRTVFRARDEGGHFGLMQLGREITQSKGRRVAHKSLYWSPLTHLKHFLGFGESSDGTTDRKVTYECHHVTMPVPSYLPGVDDSDETTWTPKTRFVTVEPALDHTAKTQFEGTKSMATAIASAYSNSPLAARDGTTMERDDYIRKNEFQNMDHASDGKKKLSLCKEWKQEVVLQDSGREIFNSLESGDFQTSLSTLSEEDIASARQQAT